MNQSTSNLTLDYTLFCEDVRVEATNHLSLMGVTHQLVVPQLPVTLIKLAVINHWRGEGQYLSEVRILTPDRMQTIAVSQPTGFSVPADGYADNVTVFVNTSFFQPGNHVVQTLINSTLFSEKTLAVMLANQQTVTESENVM
ncbi:MAG: hypothetical protein IPL01_10365 [Acidobacteria bacterium]|nr:hypothetical protein [Acidobacteriota bacterium]MBK7600591.1 hypothetical protein [Acidobacteriota bacterium]MBK8314391.1 hypothetical protein [Acidobacteriota bacterium]MBK9707545.1 hypothetical protein [Acidobacteriota bacterium]